MTTVNQTIKMLQNCYEDNLEQEIVVTWWGVADFPEEAFGIAEQQLEVCIGHVNEWVASNFEGGK